MELGLVSNRWLVGGVTLMVAFQLALTYWPPMNRLFGTAPVDAVTWLKVLAAAVVTWTIVETEKSIRRWASRRGGDEHSTDPDSRHGDAPVAPS